MSEPDEVTRGGQEAWVIREEPFMASFFPVHVVPLRDTNPACGDD